MESNTTNKGSTPMLAIPKRIRVNDPSEMPSDYSTTPGGTLYSTTPGGTRIIYDRTFLMQMRSSPLSQTPPKNLSSLPQEMLKSPLKQESKLAVKETKEIVVPQPKETINEDTFDMDM